MEAFAERYCECNPGTISDTQDTIYVLAFSVIILQTDLHNPQIKLHRKMDLESFVQNNRGESFVFVCLIVCLFCFVYLDHVVAESQKQNSGRISFLCIDYRVNVSLHGV